MEKQVSYLGYFPISFEISTFYPGSLTQKVFEIITFYPGSLTQKVFPLISTQEKTPQNNFSCQNFSLENNYSETVILCNLSLMHSISELSKTNKSSLQIIFFQLLHFYMWVQNYVMYVHTYNFFCFPVLPPLYLLLSINELETCFTLVYQGYI